MEQMYAAPIEREVALVALGAIRASTFSLNAPLLRYSRNAQLSLACRYFSVRGPHVVWVPRFPFSSVGEDIEFVFGKELADCRRLIAALENESAREFSLLRGVPTRVVNKYFPRDGVPTAKADSTLTALCNSARKFRDPPTWLAYLNYTPPLSRNMELCAESQALGERHQALLREHRPELAERLDLLASHLAPISYRRVLGIMTYKWEPQHRVFSSDYVRMEQKLRRNYWRLPPT